MILIVLENSESIQISVVASYENMDNKNSSIIKGGLVFFSGCMLSLLHCKCKSVLICIFFISPLDKLLREAHISPQRAAAMDTSQPGPSGATCSPRVQPQRDAVSANVTVRQRRTGATTPHSSKTTVIPKPSVIPRSQGREIICDIKISRLRNNL